MNRFVLGVTALALSGVLSNLAQAAAPSPTFPLLLAQSPTGAASNPYNSPIRRANPNSMQGTQPNAPAIRGPNTVPVPRPPTLDNGGIGNRYPQDRSAPASPPKFIPQSAASGRRHQQPLSGRTQVLPAIQTTKGIVHVA